VTGPAVPVDGTTQGLTQTLPAPANTLTQDLVDTLLGP
jgi:hypothetical protein